MFSTITNVQNEIFAHVQLMLYLYIYIYTIHIYDAWGWMRSFPSEFLSFQVRWLCGSIRVRRHLGSKWSSPALRWPHPAKTTSDWVTVGYPGYQATRLPGPGWGICSTVCPSSCQGHQKGRTDRPLCEEFEIEKSRMYYWALGILVTELSPAR